MVTYQDLEQSGVPIPVFAKICKIANIYAWKFRGIPARYQKTLASVIANAKRSAENKAARLAARAPQTDLLDLVPPAIVNTDSSANSRGEFRISCTLSAAAIAAGMEVIESTDNNARVEPVICNEINNLSEDLLDFPLSSLANNRESAVSLEPQSFAGLDFDCVSDFFLSLYAAVSASLTCHFLEDVADNNSLALLELTCCSLVFKTIEKYDAAVPTVDDTLDELYFSFVNLFRDPSAKSGQRLLPKEHIVLTAIRQVIAEDIERNESKYHHNLDAMSYALNSEVEKNPYLEYYYLSSIVRRIEGQVKIDTFKQIRKQGGVKPPKEHSLAAYNCGRRVMPDALKQKIYGENAPKGAVDVINCNGKFSYHGLMVCKDIWGCPTCARKITQRRQNGLSLLLNSHVEQWGQCSISATLFTIPHGLGNDLDDILNRLHKAYRFMVMSSAYKKLMKFYGLRGTVRALESTYGNNGFHPHFHVLHFFDHDIKKENSNDDADIDFIKDSLFALWTKALIRHDFTPPDARAFGCVAIATDKKSLADVADYFGKMEKDVGESDINAYLKKHKAKGVRSVDVDGKPVTHHWGEEAEMTKWHIKKGGNYHYSMFDFLRGFAISELQGDKQNQGIFKELWLTYRQGFKGRRQLYTKHKDFKISELEASDEAVADLETTEEKSIALSVTFDQWVSVLRCNARASLLRVLQTGKDSDDFFATLLNLAKQKPKEKSKIDSLSLQITALISKGLFTKKQITDYLGISFKVFDSWYYSVPIVYVPIIKKFLSQFL